ncbi:valyl-tRNA synthetase [Palleronia marisminoris]|uniref:Valine--tRNA ligase n=1 Tax=Palleronia marisminoris TaxID=315423 RepID=A0A1Y5RMX9_9RHOB|nr:valine--tRNA ligase [Palleronia marisminoris]SFG23965.1 valyl-tRNA synthetase [Palleronia marisminoris]SLN18682.1 Valine--tRNA ligase [Palleronia marisminoris]
MPMEKNFDASSAESRIYELWEREGCFAAGANAKPGAETFSIMIPPPNVTGSLHMGHAFNNTLQDILMRWKRMQGFDTLWQPGTDHAGIATQMVTEREMAANGEPTRTEMGREAFLDRVWQQKAKSRGTIIGQLKRLGASADWSREAFTMGGAPGDPDARAGQQDFHAAVIKTFVEFYNKGIIYRGKRLVNWDPHFETAISDLEVENIDQQGHMWHFKYPLAGGATYTYVEKDEDGNTLFEEVRDYIAIATTRPETMLGDGAVAVHPSDERYASIVGKLCEIPVGPKESRRLIPIITDEYPDPTFGSGAVKITGAHDFNDYGVATRNGIPLYALMDTRARMRSDGLPYAEAAEMAGEIARGEAEAPDDATQINLVPDAYRGLDRFEARAKVVEEITAEGLAVMVLSTDPRLGKAAAKPPVETEEGSEIRSDALVPLVEEKLITQPFGDRSKVVIEPMLTDQWFVDAARIVGPAIDAVRTGQQRAPGSTEGTRILPERDAKVYFHWLENIEPWCISRQLWWGHRVPVWYGLDLHTSSFHDDEGNDALDEVELLSLLTKDHLVHSGARHHSAAAFAGVVEPFRDDLASLPHPLNTARVVEVEDRHEAAHALATSLAEYNVTQDSTKLVYPVWRDPDVLDTWFSSGLWPLGTLGWTGDPQIDAQNEALQKYFPTSVLVTGFDIIFFWVARMMMMQYAMVDEKPFHTVYVHALVRDEKGRKMSKSLGNVIDPLTLSDEYGTDAVRFTLASMAAMGRDLKLSKDRVAGYRNFGTKLWNAFRFAEMNGVRHGAYKTHTDLLRDHGAQTTNRWILGELGRTRDAVQEALDDYRFNDAANTLYAFVWGRVCDWYVELAKPLFDGDAAEETRATMGFVLDQCLVLLHPFMPFVTEELWGQAERDTRLVHADWPGYTAADLIDEAADREMSWVIGLIEQIRSVRGEMNVPASLKAPLLLVELDNAGRTAFERNRALIERLARLGDISEGAAPKGAMILPVQGGSFAMPLADIIDVEAEKARIEKALGKLDKDIKGLEGRLKNPKFRESAPEDVVAETETLVTEKSADRARLAAAQERLAEI